MAPSIRWLVPLCLASVLWSFVFGVNAPLAALWLQDAGFSDTVVGLNTGTYYLGIILASSVVPYLLQRWGHGCLVAGMIASGLTTIAFPWGGSWPVWFLLQALNGAAAAVSLIPLETYVNCESVPERRAQNFGIYAFCIALGMALGTLVGLQLYATVPRTAFVLGGMAPLCAAGVVLAWRPAFSLPEEASDLRTPLNLRGNFLSFGSGWSQGFLEGGMVGLLPLYLLSVGLSDTAVSTLLSGLMIGVICAQVPVAWLADRVGRVPILVACNVVVLGGLASLMVPGGTVWLTFWLLVVGACSAASYPLGLSILGERVPPSGVARANARFLAVNCIGSLTGPTVTGAVMHLVGRGAIFSVGVGAVGLVLAIWLVLAIADRRKGRSTAADADLDAARHAA